MEKKVAIICAGDEEVKPFLKCIVNPITTEKARLQFYEGTIDGVSVVTLYCGVCKVNAAIAAQIVIDAFQVDIVVNAGTAGGVKDTVRVFDTVVTTESAYYDVAEDILTEFHPWMPSIYFPSDAQLVHLAKEALQNNGVLPGKTHFGRTVTGEKFIDGSNRDEINFRFAPLSADMETASIAHVCYVNTVPFLAVRTITDTAEHSGIAHFEDNVVRASEISREAVLTILAQIRDRYI